MKSRTQRHIESCNWENDEAYAVGCRYISNLSRPEDDPDISKWRTEVAIRIAKYPRDRITSSNRAAVV